MFVIDRALLTPSGPNPIDTLDRTLNGALSQTIEDIHRSAALNVIDLQAMPPDPNACCAGAMYSGSSVSKRSARTKHCSK
ncbi:MAG: hypothetical protein SNJ59_02675 [Aggregatilineales bacterium]